MGASVESELLASTAEIYVPLGKRFTSVVTFSVAINLFNWGLLLEMIRLLLL